MNKEQGILNEKVVVGRPPLFRTIASAESEVSLAAINELVCENPRINISAIIKFDCENLRDLRETAASVISM